MSKELIVKKKHVIKTTMTFGVLYLVQKFYRTKSKQSE